MISRGNYAIPMGGSEIYHLISWIRDHNRMPSSSPLSGIISWSSDRRIAFKFWENLYFVELGSFNSWEIDWILIKVRRI